MSTTYRTIKLDDVAGILAGDEVILIEPMSPEAFIYGYDDEGYFEKEFVFLEEDVVEALVRWADSKIIAQRPFEEKVAGYCYDIWYDEEGVDGIRPETAREQAFALGLTTN